MQVQALENCLQRQPDAVFAHRLAAMCPLLLTHNDRPSIFLDLDDVEHIALLRGIDQQWDLRAKLVSYMRVPSLWWGERLALRAARKTFVCSELDRNYLSRFSKGADLVTIPNAVRVQQPLPTAVEPTLLFLGSYQYQPNVQAADFLIKQIWPRIRSAMPTAKLIIAGKAPERIRSYGVGMQGVEFTGFVDDLRSLYERSRVFCCPIFAGSGTRIKILEAAAYGKPVVATQLGAEGLDLRDDAEIILRDSPESFAEACLKLLKDSDLCRRVGSAAREAVSNRYDRQKTIRLIQRYFCQPEAALN
jgi:glycosyltransferase involved in cell wall biosynthesis